MSYTDFIQRMERKNPSGHSIDELIANGEELALRLERAHAGEIQLSEAIDSYLQLVAENERDTFTGIKTSEIWRYFRLTWSTPAETTPGRTKNVFRSADRVYVGTTSLYYVGSSQYNRLKVPEIHTTGGFPKGHMPEEFLDGNKKAIRRNKLITGVLYYSKDMETFATGLKRIKDLCDATGCKVEFRTEKDDFVVVFYRNLREIWKKESEKKGTAYNEEAF